MADLQVVAVLVGQVLGGVVAQLLAVQQVLRGEAAADEGGVVQLDVGHGHFDALVIGFLQDGDGGFFGIGVMAMPSTPMSM